jgi:hypothetical protein
MFPLCSYSRKEVAMLFPHPRSVFDHLANAACALLVGLFFAYIGLNVASGCGQTGGTCIEVRDLLRAPPSPQLAEQPSHRAG